MSDNSSTDLEDTILEVSSMASNHGFDAAYEAFRNLFEGLYNIDTRQCQEDSPATMHLESCCASQTKLANWCTCHVIGH